MKPAIVIADDLTGAADTGVCFTRAGLSVTVVLAREDPLLCDVLVYTTESRSAGEGEARNRIRGLLPSLREAGSIYKKIDSTLRGYPGAELAEMVAGLGVEKVLVAPAFPAQGRTTVAGRQLVRGVPVEATTFRGAAAASDLAELFRACGLPIQRISLDMLRRAPSALQELFAGPGPALLIADAESDLDLQVLAGAALQGGLRLLCGSAGLAAALAERFPKQPFTPGGAPFTRRPGGVLVVAGSRNLVTLDQVGAARDAGLPVLELDPDFDSANSLPPREVMQGLNHHLAQGQDVILAVAGVQESPWGPRGVAERLALCAAWAAATHPIAGMVLTGGDIAMAVLAGLNVAGVRLHGEFSPGIPLGTLLGGDQPGLPLITKAGGFGGRDALRSAIQFLKEGGDASRQPFRER